MIKKTIRTYLGLQLAFNMAHSFFMATYVLFLVEKGLDLFEVGMVNFFFMAALFVFEIPTGAVADIFGRKFSYVAGCFVSALGLMIYFISQSFWEFVAAEIILALSASLISGAFDAWLVDSIHYYGFNGDLKKIFGQKTKVIKLAQIPTAVLGAYLGIINLALPWLAGSISMLAVAIAALVLMKEEYFVKTQRKFSQNLKQMKEIAKDSINYGIKNPRLFWLIVSSCAFVFTMQPLNMYWSVRFEEILGGRTWIGAIWLGIALALAAGSEFSGRLLPRLVKKTSFGLLVSRLVTVFSIIATVIFPWIGISIFFFLLHEAGRGMANPLVENYLHQQAPSEKRATVVSFKSMVTQGGAAIGLLFFGLLAKTFGINQTWLIASLILLLATPLVLKLKEE
jgi:MFS family permease